MFWVSRSPMGQGVEPGRCAASACVCSQLRSVPGASQPCDLTPSAVLLFTSLVSLLPQIASLPPALAATHLCSVLPFPPSQLSPQLQCSLLGGERLALP